MLWSRRTTKRQRRYLDSAVKQGATSPQSHEQLSSLLIKRGAIRKLQTCWSAAIKQMPYDALLYRLLGSSYLSLRKNSEAAALLQQAVQVFPQDAGLRKLLKDSEEMAPTKNAP